jgi:hypothetical protein
VRDHIVFREPFAIDTKATVERPTPSAFRAMVNTTTVPMLPLVRDQKRQWKAGWCSYTSGFDLDPDIEVFCGGENQKTPTGAGCWRQGNLLHFGFEQSPAEMNDAGQRLLLNCIAYISRFTEDRPIAVTPSVFASAVAYPRTYLDARLGETGVATNATPFLSERTVQQLRGNSTSEVKQWFAQNRAFLHPGSDLKLEVDTEALALGAPLDRVEFFEKTVAALRGDAVQAKRAMALLARYAPADSTKVEGADAWEQWFKENRAYLFFSDVGDYRWYVDPLAKRRGIPSAALRGPARASAR